MAFPSKGPWGQTCVVVPGPVEFLMGSPPSDKDRYKSETPHELRIGRSFVIAPMPERLHDLLKAGTHYTATSGTLTFAPGETSKGILVSTLDDGGGDPTRYFTANLSNPTGGGITIGQGIGTILDDTKFLRGQ